MKFLLNVEELMTDHHAIFVTLSVPEVAIMLGIDADFKLPPDVPHWRQKMVAAKSLLHDRLFDHPADRMPGYDNFEVAAERFGKGEGF